MSNEKKKGSTKDTLPEPVRDAPVHRDYSTDGPIKPPSVAKLAAQTGKVKPFQQVATVEGQLVHVHLQSGALVFRVAYPTGDLATLAEWANAIDGTVEIVLRKKT